LDAGPTQLAEAPVLYGHWLSAILLAEAGLTRVALIGKLDSPLAQALLAPLGETFRPAIVLAAQDPSQTGTVTLGQSTLPLFQGKPVQSAPVAWVCHRQTCFPPVSTPEALRELLDGSPRSAPAA